MHDCAHLLAPGPARPFLALVQSVVEDCGFQLVRIRITGTGTKMILQVMAENTEGALCIADCEAISHALSAVLDAENPKLGSYSLEVSSPGIARPLTRPVDFERWAGHEAKLEVAAPIDAQRRFRGLIEGFVDGEARLEVVVAQFDTPQILGFQIGNIAEARLTSDDGVLRALLKAEKGRKTEPTNGGKGRKS